MFATPLASRVRRNSPLAYPMDYRFDLAGKRKLLCDREPYTPREDHRYNKDLDKTNAKYN